MQQGRGDAISKIHVWFSRNFVCKLSMHEFVEIRQNPKLMFCSLHISILSSLSLIVVFNCKIFFYIFNYCQT